jgi:hypothetical protein
MTELRTAELKLSGFTLEVSGYFEKGERQTWDHPGSADEFEINHVELTDGTLTDLLYWIDGKKHCIEELRDLSIEYFDEYD